MTKSHNRLNRYFLVVLAVVAFAAILGAHPKNTTAGLTVIGDKAASDLAGIWNGTWEDTIYFVTGEITMTVVVDGDNYTATGSIDLTQIDSMWGVCTGTATGTLAGNTLTFTFTADTVGSGSGSLTDNAGSGAGTVTGFLEFGGFTFTGTVTDQNIDGSFAFDSPTGGSGAVTMTKGVAAEIATWGEIKSAWR